MVTEIYFKSNLAIKLIFISIFILFGNIQAVQEYSHAEVLINKGEYDKLTDDFREFFESQTEADKKLN